MNVFFTGGTGFFGRALLRYWSNESKHQPFQVTVLSRNPEAFLSQFPEFSKLSWVTWCQGDILDLSSFPAGQAFTHVLHAATDSTAGPRLNVLERYDQIVTGTRNVLDFAVAVGAKRVLLTSSGGVYGQQPPEMDLIPETFHQIPDPLNPHTAYSMAKRAAEHLCGLYQSLFGIEPVIARCFAFVGPDLPLDAHFAIGNFIRDAIAGLDIVVSGDGTAIRSYLDQRDLAHWLHVLMVSGSAGRAYNVGSSQPVSIRELASLVRDIVHPTGAVHVLGTPDPAHQKMRYVPDTHRAQSELGLRESIMLADAIRYTTCHY